MKFVFTDFGVCSFFSVTLMDPPDSRKRFPRFDAVLRSLLSEGEGARVGDGREMPSGPKPVAFHAIERDNCSLSRLLMVADGRRTYQRGVRRGNLDGMIEVLKRRMDQLLG